MMGCPSTRAEASVFRAGPREPRRPTCSKDSCLPSRLISRDVGFALAKDDWGVTTMPGSCRPAGSRMRPYMVSRRLSAEPRELIGEMDMFLLAFLGLLRLRRACLLRQDAPAHGERLNYAGDAR